jgi:hypothetical protein
VTDFGASQSFARASAQVQEHYGLELSPSRVRRVTLHHAAKLAATLPTVPTTLPRQGTALIITAADGTMLPTVSTAAAPEGADRRHHRQVRWQEVRLVAARRHGEVQATYQACLGDVDLTGRYWSRAVQDCGWGLDSTIHTVSDGAPWIYRQSRELFGQQGRFLLDFYHVSEYLAATNPPPDPRFATQQTQLKTNRLPALLSELQTRVEAPPIPEEQAPVRRALRYLQDRPDQLDYQTALQQDLPIGSGLIEGGHRHVLQHRLKLSGAWWRQDHLHNMAQLLTARASLRWKDYWN